MSTWTTCPAVERDPEKMSGAWVFRGTRVPVSALFESLRDGATIDQFLESFPGVERHQLLARPARRRPRRRSPGTPMPARCGFSRLAAAAAGTRAGGLMLVCELPEMSMLFPLGKGLLCMSTQPKRYSTFRVIVT